LLERRIGISLEIDFGEVLFQYGNVKNVKREWYVRVYKRYKSVLDKKYMTYTNHILMKLLFHAHDVKKTCKELQKYWIVGLNHEVCLMDKIILCIPTKW
jgi:hypothetical protein